MMGGGRDNLVENNIFVDCIPAFHTDDRWDAYPWDYMRERLEAMNYKQPPYSERYPQLRTLDEDDPRRPANNRFLRNVVSYRRDDFAGFWHMRQREGAAIIYHLTPFDPDSDVFDHNLVHHFGLPIRVEAGYYKQAAPHQGVWSWEQWRSAGFDAHTIIADPLFLDAERDDYRLRPGSPAFGQGFQRIPIERMGLYRSPLRASWPVPADTRKTGGEMARYEVKLAPPGR
jgi:hypothetical protein